MELPELTEPQLELAHFAMSQALNSARENGVDLPFVVIDRETGRELTWLEDKAQAASLSGPIMATVSHEVLPADHQDEGSSEGITAVVVALSGESLAEHVAIAQPYRRGGHQRRFVTLGQPFRLETATV
jgi:hypothetical protein